jgi:hypothetical protein
MMAQISENNKFFNKSGRGCVRQQGRNEMQNTNKG